MSDIKKLSYVEMLEKIEHINPAELTDIDDDVKRAWVALGYNRCVDKLEAALAQQAQPEWWSDDEARVPLPSDSQEFIDGFNSGFKRAQAIAHRVWDRMAQQAQPTCDEQNCQGHVRDRTALYPERSTAPPREQIERAIADGWRDGPFAVAGKVEALLRGEAKP